MLVLTAKYDEEIVIEDKNGGEIKLRFHYHGFGPHRSKNPHVRVAIDAPGKPIFRRKLMNSDGSQSK